MLNILQCTRQSQWRKSLPKLSFVTPTEKYWVATNKTIFNRNKYKILHHWLSNQLHKDRTGDMRLKCSSCQEELGLLVDHKLNRRQQNEETAKGLTWCWQHFRVQIKGAMSQEVCISYTGHREVIGDTREVKLSSTGRLERWRVWKP